jgi:hypothetical protein
MLANWHILLEARGSLDDGHLFGYGLGASDLSFGEASAMPEWDEIAQIHQPEAKTPLLVVFLAERGLGGGTIGLGKGCQRNWRRGRPELCSRGKECQKKEREYHFIGGHKKVPLIPC